MVFFYQNTICTKWNKQNSGYNLNICRADQLESVDPTNVFYLWHHPDTVYLKLIICFITLYFSITFCLSLTEFK